MFVFDKNSGIKMINIIWIVLNFDIIVFSMRFRRFSFRGIAVGFAIGDWSKIFQPPLVLKSYICSRFLIKIYSYVENLQANCLSSCARQYFVYCTREVFQPAHYPDTDRGYD